MTVAREPKHVFTTFKWAQRLIADFLIGAIKDRLQFDDILTGWKHFQFTILYSEEISFKYRIADTCLPSTGTLNNYKTGKKNYTKRLFSDPEQHMEQGFYL